MSNVLKGILLMAAVAVLLFTGAAQMNAAENIYVSCDNVMYEYQLDGTYVGEVAIPGSPDGGPARDLVFVDDEVIAVFNGTFAPRLSLYNKLKNSWNHYTTDGWSVRNEESNGGIAAFQGYVYVTDQKTGGVGAPKGVNCFFTPYGYWQRYLSANNYIDLTLGLNGKMYGLKNKNGSVTVFTPGDWTAVQNLELGSRMDLRALAVAGNGDIYAASWDGTLYRYNAYGELTDWVFTDYPYLTDIDINASGTIILGQAYFGTVLVTDADFTSISEITVPGYYGTTFATFCPPQSAVEYCSASALAGNWEWIAGVRIGTFNNTSNTGLYSDFTTMTIDLNKGETYETILTPGFEDNAFPQMWKVWIDFNQDGDFDDAGEEVLAESYDWTIYSYISIPNDAPTGNTRMRVAMAKGNTWPLPCGTFSNGEVEDYTVYIH